MALRAFELPGDLSVISDLIPPTFQYPENEEWSIQSDEVESFVDSISGIRRIWLLVRLIQFVSPPMRDILRGYVWEEEGKPVGLVNVLRQGNTDQWLIGNVAVLPEYRRRGIARQLVAASVEYAKGRDAKVITLDVLDGNVPAYTLYQTLGFEHFSGQVQMECEPDGPPPDGPPLPEGHTLEPVSLFDWKLRYEFADRITPDMVRKYRPVEPGRFRQPPLLRLLMPVVTRAIGARPHAYALRDAQGQVVATGMINVRIRKGGINQMNVTLDPARGDLGPFLFRFLLSEIHRYSPGRRIEIDIPQWQTPTIEAAQEAGFTRRYNMHALGMIP